MKRCLQIFIREGDNNQENIEWYICCINKQLTIQFQTKKTCWKHGTVLDHVTLYKYMVIRCILEVCFEINCNHPTKLDLNISSLVIYNKLRIMHVYKCSPTPVYNLNFIPHWRVLVLSDRHSDAWRHWCWNHWGLRWSGKQATFAATGNCDSIE